MSIRLVRGTIESVQVTVVDSSGAITNLASSSPQFDVTKLDGTAVVTNVAASATGMVIYCLVNTTTWPAAPDVNFRLFVHFTVGSETPRLGPFGIGLVS
jgi:hypothetical protein